MSKLRWNSHFFPHRRRLQVKDDNFGKCGVPRREHCSFLVQLVGILIFHEQAIFLFSVTRWDTAENVYLVQDKNVFLFIFFSGQSFSGFKNLPFILAYCKRQVQVKTMLSLKPKGCNIEHIWYWQISKVQRTSSRNGRYGGRLVARNSAREAATMEVPEAFHMMVKFWQNRPLYGCRTEKSERVNSSANRFRFW